MHSGPEISLRGKDIHSVEVQGGRPGAFDGAKNKDDEKAKEAYEKLKAAAGELKAHGEELDLDDFNVRMM